MKLKGFTHGADSPEPAYPVIRFYGTKEVFKYPDGTVKPQPGSWELVCEFEIRRSRGRWRSPAFELEFTQPGGWRFYNFVVATRQGQETWHPDNDIIFPREMWEEFGGEVDWPTLLLYNLELKGVIAPGQLRD
jgi:hypothetical protein